MTSSQASLRGLIIYGTVLPLAIFLGYQLANPLAQDSLAWVGLIFLVLVTPLVLKWHHPLLFLSWNMTAVMFVPGRPQLWMVMAFVSLGIFILQYALARNVEFIKNRSMLYPVLFMVGVVVVTAQLTGGIGLSMFGAEQIGGRKYIFIIAAAVGYIAMTAHRIPASRANLYLGLFLLGALTNAIGNLVAYLPPAFYPIFSVFPVERQGIAAVLSKDLVVGDDSISRFYGLSLALMGLAYFFVAKHGLGAVLNPRKSIFWFFLVALASSTLGGFRSFLILSLMTVGFVFWLEGLHRSRKMPALVLTGVLTAVLIVGFSDRMPFSIQRSLSFLPLRIDPKVEMNAKNSSEWRIQMWERLYGEVPGHLLLGKGLSISSEELNLITTLEHQGQADSAEIAILTGDYHNGPLSVVLSFGIWGVLAWAWFVIAGLRTLILNHRYGPPELRTINTFLLAYFSAKMVLFHAVFGFLPTDFPFFVGLLGFSIALNGGICKPEPPDESELSGSLARPRLISFANSLRR